MANEADGEEARATVDRIADAVDRGELAAPFGWSTTARTMAAGKIPDDQDEST